MTDALVRPIVTDLNRGFWEGLRDERVVVHQCRDCGHLRYPFADVCPVCLTRGFSWTEISPLGEVLTYAIFHQVYHPRWADRVPYNVVLVQLDDGPRMVSNVVPLSRTDLSVGMRVKAVFVDEDDLCLLRFAEDDSFEDSGERNHKE